LGRCIPFISFCNQAWPGVWARKGTPHQSAKKKKKIVVGSSVYIFFLVSLRR
jgi:hypothetical protein